MALSLGQSLYRKILHNHGQVARAGFTGQNEKGPLEMSLQS